MITVTKQFKFDAAHKLPHYNGLCHNVHGHTYHVDVTVTGNLITDESSPKRGMIIDFKDLKSLVWDKVLKKYDHSWLNDYFSNPTAEIMVEHIGVAISTQLPVGVKLVSVKLWEGDESYAEYTPNKEV